jgi:hypothetical protein
VQGIANQVTLAYYDTSTPTTKAKPAGAIGLELRRTIATNAGTDPEAASLVGIVTKSPTVVAHGSGDRGKLATFWGRWSTRSGPGGVAQSGPWSDALVVVLG